MPEEQVTVLLPVWNVPGSEQDTSTSVFTSTGNSLSVFSPDHSGSSPVQVPVVENIARSYFRLKLSIIVTLQLCGQLV